MRRHNVERLQPFATPELNDFLDQLNRRGRGKRAVEQRQRDKRHQQSFTHGAEQRCGLLQVALVNIQRGLQPLAGRVVGGEQAFTTVVDQMTEEVERAKQDAAPDHFIAEEARQRDVADNQRNQNRHGGDRQRQLHQADDGRTRFRRIAGLRHATTHAIGAHADRQPGAANQQRRQAVGKNGGVQAGADRVVKRLGGLEDKHQRGGNRRERLQRQRHFTGDARQTPARAAR